MGKVTSLQRQEPARLDSRAIEILENSLGTIRCREVIEQACFDMVDKLGRLEYALEQGEIDKTKGLAKKIAALSTQIGLEDFSRVARDLHSCLSSDDTVAHKAVASRLMRLGETSLMSMMQMTEDPYD